MRIKLLLTEFNQFLLLIEIDTYFMKLCLKCKIEYFKLVQDSIIFSTEFSETFPSVYRKYSSVFVGIFHFIHSLKELSITITICFSRSGDTSQRLWFVH